MRKLPVVHCGSPIFYFWTISLFNWPIVSINVMLRFDFGSREWFGWGSDFLLGLQWRKKWKNLHEVARKTSQNHSDGSRGSTALTHGTSEARKNEFMLNSITMTSNEFFVEFLVRYIVLRCTPLNRIRTSSTKPSIRFVVLARICLRGAI